MAEGMGWSLGAMLFYGLADWVFKRAAARGIQAHHFLALQAFFFAPGIFLYGLTTNTLALGKPFLWGMAAGVLIFVAFYNFSRSLASGAVSVVAPVFRLSFAITAALAVCVLGEHLTGWKIAGLSASLAAVWLLLSGGPASTAHLSRSTMIQVLVATLAMGFVSFIYKLGVLAGGRPATVLAGQVSTFFPLATLFAIVRDRGFHPPPGAWRYGAIAALPSLFAVILLLAGLALGEASVLVPIAQMSCVVTAGLGLIFLREALTFRKGLGLAFALAALTCFARS